MKKIVITNAYTWDNKGDSGILLATVELLKKIYGDLEINIFSFTPEKDKSKYCKDNTIKNVYSNVLNPYPFKHNFLGKTFAVIKMFIKMIYLVVMSHISLKTLINNYEELKILNESDLIIVCGGGFLGGKKYDSFMHVFQISVNTWFKKTTIMMGTSIEPIHSKIIKKYTEKILKKLDFIFAREKITYDYLSTFMNKDKFDIIPDMAFMLEDKKIENQEIIEIKKNYKYLCGITVRKWNFPQYSNSYEMMENYINSLVGTIDFCYKNYNMVFVFVPQVIVEYANDIFIAEKIKEKLVNQDALIINKNDLTPPEIKGLISNFDFFIGTRMHSNIFATSMSIPTIAIAYEQKTNGIMEMLNLKDYVLDINNITEEMLLEKISKLMTNKDQIKKSLKIRIEQMKKEIEEKISKKLGGI